MRQTEVHGYRPEDTNPCADIKRYRRQRRTRFLSTAEIRRLGEVLTRHEADHPQAVAIIRLLLLTGCRQGEIVSLTRSLYREDKLFLPDSKSGPRTVWLSSDARAMLDSVPRGSAWIFPSPQTGSHLNGETVCSVWCRVRAEADIRDVRLHDLRPRFASRAVLQGVPLPVVSRLLGHQRPSIGQHRSESSKAEREVDADEASQAGNVLTDVVVRHCPLQRDASPIAMHASAASAAMMPAA